MSITADHRLRPGLQEQLAATKAGCTNCGDCVQECAFLKKYGTPKAIGESFAAAEPASLARSFECSLCGLCSTVCPEGLDLDGLFIEMRREAVDRGFGDYPEHTPLFTYERLGTSRRFSLYRLPQGCRTIFFPGCSLSGTRPDGVNKLFAELQKVDPKVGIVFDCCLKPSHSLGREQYVDAMFAEMKVWLLEQGVEEVLVACPNCQTMFDTLGRGLTVRTVWEALAESGLQPEAASGTVTVHDPCVIRNAGSVHHAVRTLLKRQGLTIEEMLHFGRTTVCCGKGGAVNLLNPELAASWGELRQKEAAGRRIITYCAGCVQALGGQTPISHLVDLLFAPEKTLAGEKKGSRAPITYLNRLLLKRAFKRKEGFTVSRERTFVPPGEPKKRSWKPLIICMLPACIASIVFSSSLLGLIKGKVSPPALLGIGLILLVSLLPVLHRRFKRRSAVEAVTE